jgi:hypothetical protein
MAQELICYCFNYTAEDIRKDFNELRMKRKMVNAIVSQLIPKEDDA